jgi:hypothetical protein
MNLIDLMALCIVCATVLAIYLLERRFLAVMRTDAKAYMEEAKTWADLAMAHRAEAHKAADDAERHAVMSVAMADRAQNALDKERIKVEGRLASLEARLR